MRKTDIRPQIPAQCYTDARYVFVWQGERDPEPAPLGALDRLCLSLEPAEYLTLPALTAGVIPLA